MTKVQSKTYHKVIVKVASATIPNVERAAYNNDVPSDATFSFVPSPENSGFVIRNDGGMVIGNNTYGPVEVWVEFKWTT